MSAAAKRVASRYMEATISVGPRNKLRDLGVRMQRDAKEVDRFSRIWADLADNVVRLSQTAYDDDPDDFELLLREVGNAQSSVQQEQEQIFETLQLLSLLLKPFHDEI
jgi:hypothetical protein